MKCPKCGKEVEIQKRKAGVDSGGYPVYNRYAVCRDCKKMWNLDRPKTRKPDIASAVENRETKKISGVKSGSVPAARTAKNRQSPGAGPAARAAIDRQTPAKKRPRYGNIPPEAVRSKSEKSVKESYTSMLSTDPSGVAVKDRVEQKPEKKPVYRAFRIVLGIFAVLSAGLFGYMAYLSDLKTLSISNLQSPVTVYVVLAACMLLSGAILLSAQKSNSVFAFLIPMLTSLTGTLFTFMSQSDLSVVKIHAIGCSVFTVILLVITITSRFALSFGDDYEDYDDDGFYASEKPKKKRRVDDEDYDFYNDDDE